MSATKKKNHISTENIVSYVLYFSLLFLLFISFRFLFCCSFRFCFSVDQAPRKYRTVCIVICLPMSAAVVAKLHQTKNPVFHSLFSNCLLRFRSNHNIAIKHLHLRCTGTGTGTGTVTVTHHTIRIHTVDTNIRHTHKQTLQRDTVCYAGW